MKILRTIIYAFLIALSTAILHTMSSNGETTDNFSAHNTTGIELIKQRRYEEALGEFQLAAKLAIPQSADELTARQNILAACESLGNKEQIWHANKDLALLQNKIDGTPIPTEYSVSNEVEVAGAEQSSLEGRFQRARLDNSLSDESLEEFTKAGLQLAESFATKNSPNKVRETFQAMEERISMLSLSQRVQFYHAFTLLCEKHHLSELAAEYRLKLTNVAKQVSALSSMNEEQQYRDICGHIISAPQWSNDTKIRRELNASVLLCETMRRQLPEIINSHRLISGKSGTALLLAKADAVQERDEFIANTNSLYKLEEDLRSYSVQFGTNTTMASIYFLQNLYSFYRAVDQNDRHLPLIYKQFVELRTREAQGILNRAARYR